MHLRLASAVVAVGALVACSGSSTGAAASSTSSSTSSSSSSGSGSSASTTTGSSGSSAGASGASSGSTGVSSGSSSASTTSSSSSTGVSSGSSSASTSSSSSSSGSSGASGTTGAPDGGNLDGGDTSPITAAPDQWTWVDFPSSRCASGTPTGLAVNPHAGSTDLIIYMEGGGACSNATTCWGTSPKARNLAGYDATTFASAQQVNYALLNRTLASNPFAAANMVYVPYCTGDMHAGTIESDLPADGGVIPTYFWGANDLDLFLARVVPTFPGATHVWLYGTSAGGYGTILNFDRVARAFGVRVDIIDDSGPPIPPNGGTNNANSFSTWGVIPPAGCVGCDSFRAVFDFDRQSQPSSQYAFLSFAEDSVISVDFGYTPTTFPPVLDSFSTSLAGDPNAATYIVTNKQSHVVESDPTLIPDFMPWIQQMVANDGGWSDQTFVHP